MQIHAQWIVNILPQRWQYNSYFGVVIVLMALLLSFFPILARGIFAIALF
jgi:hypothetical protein